MKSCAQNRSGQFPWAWTCAGRLITHLTLNLILTLHISGPQRMDSCTWYMARRADVVRNVLAFAARLALPDVCAHDAVLLMDRTMSASSAVRRRAQQP